VPPDPSVDESFAGLHVAGWSVGETGTATRWLVCGVNGENAVMAAGGSQAEAWNGACEQAVAVGKLAPRAESQNRPGAAEEADGGTAKGKHQLDGRATAEAALRGRSGWGDHHP
jgi:hypothetical protein